MQRGSELTTSPLEKNGKQYITSASRIMTQFNLKVLLRQYKSTVSEDSEKRFDGKKTRLPT